MIQPPALLGIADPVTREPEDQPRAAATITRRTAWQALHGPPLAATGRRELAEQTDLNLDPAVDHDRFGPLPPAQEARDTDEKTEASTPAASSAAPARSRRRW